MVELVETKIVGRIETPIGQEKALSGTKMFKRKANQRIENKSKPVDKTKTNQRVKHSVLFVKSLTQKVILRKHSFSVCIASYGHMNIVSPIHSEH